jgi:hypothetical protein
MLGTFDFALIATAPKIIVRNENKMPNQPKPITVSAPSPPKAAPTPPINIVTTAAITPKYQRLRK